MIVSASTAALLLQLVVYRTEENPLLGSWRLDASKGSPASCENIAELDFDATTMTAVDVTGQRVQTPAFYRRTPSVMFVSQDPNFSRVLHFTFLDPHRIAAENRLQCVYLWQPGQAQ